MKFVLFFLLVFMIIGCQEPDRDELKRINNISEKKVDSVKSSTIKKSLFDDIKESENTLKEDNKNKIKDEDNKKIDKVSKNEINEIKKLDKDLNLSEQKQIVVVKKIDEVQKQKLLNEQRLKELEFKNRQKLKELEFKNRQKIQEDRLKIEQKQKEYEQQKWIYEKKSSFKLYQIIIILTAFLILIIFLLFYFYKRKSSQNKFDLEREKFHREKDLELYKLQNERLEKIVDIVTTKDLSKENESKLLNIISEETKKGQIIEVEPKKKGLFFKS